MHASNTYPRFKVKCLLPDEAVHVRAPHRRSVATWLIVCAALVALMVAVGGYTRLSGSGLSITEWKPIHGVVPPIGEAEWQEEFAAYRATPQYAKINMGISLPEFKSIYWPEYLHRLLGRAIGFVFFAPFLFFAAQRAFSFRFGARLFGIFLLGGAQGLMGWLMVKSGLVNDPFVSHFRLTAHLALAFALFGLLVWSVLDVLSPRAGGGPRIIYSRTWIPAFAGILSLLSLQILFGALLAGLHGGLIYNTFPTMNGEWIPSGLLTHPSLWQNLTENIAAIQFIHRWLAKILLVAYAFWWWCARRHARNRVADALLAMLLAQGALGVATLLLHVPLWLALAHQLNALAVFGLAVALLHRLKS